VRRLALFAVAVYAVLLGLVVVWRLQDIVLVLLASLAAAATARPLIQWLESRRVPTGLAVLAVYLAAGLGAAAILLVLYDRLGQELGSVAEDLGYVYARLRAEFRFLEPISPSVSARFPTPEQLTQWLTDSEVGALEQTVMAAGQNFVRLVGDAALVLILSIYWTADRLRFERLVLSFLSPDRRASARRIWRKIEQRLGRYLRGELLRSLLAGTLMAAVLLALGVQWAILWSLAVAVAWLVPMVGGLLVIGPMALIVYVQSGPTRAAIAVAAVLIIMLLLEGFLAGVMQKRERGANVLTLMTVLLMTDAFGIVGLVLSPPVAEALHALFTEFVDPAARRTDPTSLTEDVGSLQARLEKARLLVPAEDSERQEKRLGSLADRLEELLAEAYTVGN